ncbi:MAG: hypothetical protein RIR49_1430 [Actinomycetota bacterium]
MDRRDAATPASGDGRLSSWGGSAAIEREAGLLPGDRATPQLVERGEAHVEHQLGRHSGPVVRAAVHEVRAGWIEGGDPVDEVGLRDVDEFRTSDVTLREFRRGADVDDPDPAAAEHVGDIDGVEHGDRCGGHRPAARRVRHG